MSRFLRDDPEWQDIVAEMNAAKNALDELMAAFLDASAVNRAAADQSAAAFADLWRVRSLGAPPEPPEA